MPGSHSSTRFATKAATNAAPSKRALARPMISLHDEPYAHARADVRYDVRRLFSSSVPGCDCSSPQGGLNNSLGSLPHADSDWLVPVGLDNARISRRISASRSGCSGDVLICVIDAADLNLCLLLRFFLLTKEPVLHTGSVPPDDFALLACA